MTTPPLRLETWEEPQSVRWTTAYLKRLLIERHAIRARLENPGGSVIVSSARKIETETAMDYSSVIGNDYHLDLLDAESVVNGLAADERIRLLLWCDGFSAADAAQFANVKGSVRRRAASMARTRSLDSAVEKLNDQPADSGGAG